MAQTTGDITKKKRAAQKGTPILVRLQPDQLTELDHWIGQQTPQPTRPEAVRAILRGALKSQGED